jgi:hypothetical protein
MMEAMMEKKVKRIISLTCFWNYSNHSSLFKFFSSTRLKYVKKNQEEMIDLYRKRKHDDIRWTVVRSFRLTFHANEPRILKAGTVEDKIWERETNIKDLAGFLVTEAKLTYFLWDFPIVGYSPF